MKKKTAATSSHATLITIWFAALAVCALLVFTQSAWATPASQSVSTTKPTTQETPLKAGTYFIQTSLPRTYMLDVSGASKANGANVQIYTSNNTAAQKWRVTIDKQGYYSFQNVASGKYLDVSGGVARNSKNVWQYASNNTKAQKWTVTKNGNGYTIASAINKKFVLDVSGAKAADGTNVQVYQANGTTAQRWWFIPTKYSVPSAKTVANGLYEIQFTKNTSFVLDVSGASSKNGANIQLYKKNNTAAQRWIITRQSDGYYSIKSYASSRVLDVSGANPAARTNVQQWEGNQTPAQKWAIVENKNGSYSFINAVSGMALDIAGAKASNGANAQVYLAQRGSSQQFTLKAVSPVSAGTYTIYSCLASTRSVLDVKGASTKAGANLQLYTNNNSLAQKFQLRRVSGNTYQIQAVNSGLYLQDSNGKVVQQKRNASSKAQQWQVAFENNGIAFTNVATGKRLAVSGGKATNGATLITTAAKNTNAQHFIAKSTNLVPNGYYFIQHATGKVIDIAGGSYNNGANAQIYAKNNSAAQKFNITKSGSAYRIESDCSGKLLDVAGGSKANGANVQQYQSNGSAAQQWTIELGIDGGVIIVNKGSGMALDVQGTNVVQKKKAGSASQRWTLIATTSSGISGNAELDRYIRQIVAQNGGDLQRCFNWTVNNIKWTNSVSGEVLSNGIVSKQKTIDYALYGFRNHRGDCYYHASVFKWLAIGCGYKAEVRAGSVPSASQGLAPHGWTEVYVNGTTYICDPNLALDIGGRNWYMVTYANAPVQYYR